MSSPPRIAVTDPLRIRVASARTALPEEQLALIPGIVAEEVADPTSATRAELDTLYGGSGGGSGDPVGEASLVVVRPSKGDVTTFQAICRQHGVLTSSTNPETVIQAAIDHASNYATQATTGHTSGGTVFLAAHEYNIDTSILGRPVQMYNISGPIDAGAGAATTDTYTRPIRIVGEGGMSGPKFGYGAEGGTVLRWTGADANTSTVLDLGYECHSYRVEDLVVDGQGDAGCCIKSVGAHSWFTRVIAKACRSDATAKHFWVAGGTSDEQDTYVGAHFTNCYARGLSAGWGWWVDGVGSGGMGPTDGNMTECRALQCGHGWARFDSGGWMVNGGHYTSDSSSLVGFDVNSSFTHIMNAYLDAVGGPSVDISSNHCSVSNNYVVSGKSGNTVSAVKSSGNYTRVSNNSFYDKAVALLSYVEHTSASPTGLVAVGNTGGSRELLVRPITFGTAAGVTNATNKTFVEQNAW